jgi:hypothetical protein
MAGCGLLDGASNLSDATDYLPAGSMTLRFSDRAAMAERQGVDDIDPRDVDEDDVDAYFEAVDGEVAASDLAPYASLMKDRPLNEFDVEWEAFAVWDGGAATVWKVGDEVDFEALADDLAEVGYEEGEAGDRQVFSAPESLVEFDGLVGAAYPREMTNVLLDPDERLVVASLTPDALEQVAEVIEDDADSLTDDGGDLAPLLDAAEDVEHASITTGENTCVDRQLPPQAEQEYDELGHPDGRAFFVAADDQAVRFVLAFPDEDEAESDLEAREDLLADGVEPFLRLPYDELGEFALERDGSLVLIDADFEDGLRDAGNADLRGGPAFCLSE